MSPGRLSTLVSELRRRRVFRVAAVYCVVAWLVIQVAVTTFPVLLLPAWLMRAVVVLAVLGLPVALVLGWAFDITAEGVRRTETVEEAEGGPAGGVVSPAVRAAFAAIVVLVTAASGLAAWRLWLQPRAEARAAASEEPALDPATVAVLYFDDHSPAGELAYLAGGLTESLIHELSQFDALQVISRNGVKPFRNPQIPVDSLARLLGAGSLVEGSVERSGTGLVATVQLIDGSTGTHLLSERIEEAGDDLLGLRDGIVRRAARLLSQQLGRQLQWRQSRPETESAEAWELVQRARHMREDADTLRWSLGDIESAAATLEDADSLLAVAEAADPGWPEPSVRRGWIAHTRARLRAGSRARYDESRIREGLEHAERALALDPGNAAGLELRGALRYDLTWLESDSAAVDALRRSAESDLRAAVAADSSRARAWVELADLLRSRGRFSEASVAAGHALEADPFLINAELEILFTLAHVWLELEDLERANRWADEGRRRYPAQPSFAAEKLLILAGGEGASGVRGGSAPAGRGTAVVAVGDSAWGLLEDIVEGYGLPGWPYGELMVAATLARAGLADSARSVVGRVRGQLPEDPWADYYEANVRLGLGEREAALGLLDRYLEAMPHRREYIARDWWWRPLRNEARFRELVGAAGD